MFFTIRVFGLLSRETETDVFKTFRREMELIGWKSGNNVQSNAGQHGVRLAMSENCVRVCWLPRCLIRGGDCWGWRLMFYWWLSWSVPQHSGISSQLPGGKVSFWVEQRKVIISLFDHHVWVHMFGTSCAAFTAQGTKKKRNIKKEAAWLCSKMEELFWGPAMGK